MWSLGTSEVESSRPLCGPTFLTGGCVGVSTMGRWGLGGLMAALSFQGKHCILDVSWQRYQEAAAVATLPYRHLHQAQVH